MIGRIATGAGAAAGDATPARPTHRRRRPSEPRRRAGGRARPRPRTPRRSRAAPPPRSTVDLGALAGSGPAGRIVKVDVLEAAARRERGAAPATAGETVTVMKGGAAMLARYMDESRTVPTATSFRTIAVTTLDARRRQLKARGREGVVHPPDRLRDRARGDRAAGHGRSLRARSTGARRGSATAGVNLGLAVDVERKDGSRTLMVPVIRDAGSLALRRASSPPTTRSSRRRARTRSWPTTSPARTSP